MTYDMELELNKKVTLINTYSKLKGNLGYGDTVCGFVLQIFQDNEKIFVVNNMYMCGTIIGKEKLYFENEQQAKDYCLSYMKELDNFGNNKTEQKCQSLFG